MSIYTSLTPAQREKLQQWRNENEDNPDFKEFQKSAERAAIGITKLAKHFGGAA